MPATGRFIVRWTDDKGSSRRQEYSNRELAQKALKWLEDNGVTDGDIAVEFVEAKKVEEKG